MNFQRTLPLAAAAACFAVLAPTHAALAAGLSLLRI